MWGSLADLNRDCSSQETAVQAFFPRAQRRRDQGESHTGGHTLPRGCPGLASTAVIAKEPIAILQMRALPIAESAAVDARSS